MVENPRRGRQARNFTTNVPKILDLKSSSEQIFFENCRWVPLPGLASWREWKLYDLSADLGIPSVDLNTEPLLMKYEMMNTDINEQSLNKEQKEFSYHVLHLIKISNEQFCFCVGKSHVTKALYQAALKYYKRKYWC